MQGVSLIVGLFTLLGLQAAGASSLPLTSIEGQFAEPNATGTGLLLRYFFNEGAGTTLFDSSGNQGNNDSFSGLSTLPTWNNGALNWLGGVTPAVPLPAAVEGVHTWEIGIVNAVAVPVTPGALPVSAYNSFLSYSTGYGTSLQVSSTYSGLSMGQGYGTKWIQFHHPNEGATNLLGTIDNGPHFLSMTLDSANKIINVMLDGGVLPDATTPPAVSTITLTGIAWQIGGDSAGSCSGNLTACGYGGGINYLGASTTLETVAQQVQDYHAWQQLEQLKGVIVSTAYGPTTIQGIPRATSTGSTISGTTLTIAGSITGNYAAGQTISGTGVTPGTTITALGTSTGGAGTATLNNSLSVTTAEAINGFNNIQEANLGVGESVLTAYGLSPINTSNFLYFASTYLDSAYPNENWNGTPDGANNETGYIMMSGCASELNAIGQTVSGPKILTINFHGNDQSEATGAYQAGVAFYPSPADQTAQAQTAAELDGVSKCLSQVSVGGLWHVDIATVIGGPNAAGDAADKALTNPLYRQLAPNLGFTVIEFDGDQRFGANGAGGMAVGVKNCIPDPGTDGGHATDTTYQMDMNHPSVCGQEVLGHMKAAADALALNAPYAPEQIAATSYTMGLTDLGRPITLSGAATTLQLPPCGGLLAGTRVASVRDGGGSADMVQATTEYNGGAQDLIDGSSTFTLPSDGRPRNFIVTFAGDATGGCGYTVQ